MIIGVPLDLFECTNFKRFKAQITRGSDAENTVAAQLVMRQPRVSEKDVKSN